MGRTRAAPSWNDYTRSCCFFFRGALHRKTEELIRGLQSQVEKALLKLKESEQNGKKYKHQISEQKKLFQAEMDNAENQKNGKKSKYRDMRKERNLAVKERNGAVHGQKKLMRQLDENRSTPEVIGSMKLKQFQAHVLRHDESHASLEAEIIVRCCVRVAVLLLLFLLSPRRRDRLHACDR